MATVTVRINAEEAERELRELESRINAIAGRQAVEIPFSTKRIEDDLDRLAHRLNQMRQTPITLPFRADTDQVKAELREVDRLAKEIADRQVRIQAMATPAVASTVRSAPPGEDVTPRQVSQAELDANTERVRQGQAGQGRSAEQMRREMRETLTATEQTADALDRVEQEAGQAGRALRQGTGAGLKVVDAEAKDATESLERFISTQNRANQMASGALIDVQRGRMHPREAQATRSIAQRGIIAPGMESSLVDQAIAAETLKDLQGEALRTQIQSANQANRIAESAQKTNAYKSEMIGIQEKLNAYDIDRVQAARERGRAAARRAEQGEEDIRIAGDIAEQAEIELNARQRQQAVEAAMRQDRQAKQKNLDKVDKRIAHLQEENRIKDALVGKQQHILNAERERGILTAANLGADKERQEVMGDLERIAYNNKELLSQQTREAQATLRASEKQRQVQEGADKEADHLKERRRILEDLNAGRISEIEYARQNNILNKEAAGYTKERAETAADYLRDIDNEKAIREYNLGLQKEETREMKSRQRDHQRLGRDLGRMQQEDDIAERLHKKDIDRLQAARERGEFNARSLRGTKEQIKLAGQLAENEERRTAEQEKRNRLKEAERRAARSAVDHRIRADVGARQDLDDIGKKAEIVRLKQIEEGVDRNIAAELSRQYERELRNTAEQEKQNRLKEVERRAARSAVDHRIRADVGARQDLDDIGKKAEIVRLKQIEEGVDRNIAAELSRQYERELRNTAEQEKQNRLKEVERRAARSAVDHRIRADVGARQDLDDIGKKAEIVRLKQIEEGVDRNIAAELSRQYERELRNTAEQEKQNRLKEVERRAARSAVDHRIRADVGARQDLDDIGKKAEIVRLKQIEEGVDRNIAAELSRQYERELRNTAEQEKQNRLKEVERRAARSAVDHRIRADVGARQDLDDIGKKAEIVRLKQIEEGVDRNIAAELSRQYERELRNTAEQEKQNRLKEVERRAARSAVDHRIRADVGARQDLDDIGKKAEIVRLKQIEEGVDRNIAAELSRQYERELRNTAEQEKQNRLKEVERRAARSAVDHRIRADVGARQDLDDIGKKAEIVRLKQIEEGVDRNIAAELSRQYERELRNTAEQEKQNRLKKVEQDIALKSRENEIRMLRGRGEITDAQMAGKMAAALAKNKGYSDEIAEAAEKEARERHESLEAVEKQRKLEQQRAKYEQDLVDLRNRARLLKQVQDGTRNLASVEEELEYQKLRGSSATEAQARETAKLNREIREQEQVLQKAARRTNILHEIWATMRRTAKFALIGLPLIAAARQLQNAVYSIGVGYIRLNRMALDYSVQVQTASRGMGVLIDEMRSAGQAQQGLNVQQLTESLALGEVAYQKIVRRSAEVLGSAEEHLGVTQLVLGYSRDQEGSLNERLEASARIAHIGRLLGMQGQNLVKEARQIFELETKRGQQILNALGIDFKRAKELKAQGLWLQFFLEKTEATYQRSLSLADTWELMQESSVLMTKEFSRLQFTNIFRQGSHILRGYRDEMSRAIDQHGGFSAAIGLSNQELQQMGANLAKLAQILMREAANWTATLLELADTAVEVADKAIPDTLEDKVSPVMAVAIQYRPQDLLGQEATQGFRDIADELSENWQGATRTAFAKERNPVKEAIQKDIDALRNLNEDSTYVDAAKLLDNLATTIRHVKVSDELRPLLQDYITFSERTAKVLMLRGFVPGGAISAEEGVENIEEDLKWYDRFWNLEKKIRYSQAVAAQKTLEQSPPLKGGLSRSLMEAMKANKEFNERHKVKDDTESEEYQKVEADINRLKQETELIKQANAEKLTSIELSRRIKAAQLKEKDGVYLIVDAWLKQKRIRDEAYAKYQTDEKLREEIRSLEVRNRVMDEAIQKGWDEVRTKEELEKAELQVKKAAEDLIETKNKEQKAFDTKNAVHQHQLQIKALREQQQEIKKIIQLRETEAQHRVRETTEDLVKSGLTPAQAANQARAQEEQRVLEIVQKRILATNTEIEILQAVNQMTGSVAEKEQMLAIMREAGTAQLTTHHQHLVENLKAVKQQTLELEHQRTLESGQDRLTSMRYAIDLLNKGVSIKEVEIRQELKLLELQMRREGYTETQIKQRLQLEVVTRREQERLDQMRNSVINLGDAWKEVIKGVALGTRSLSSAFKGMGEKLVGDFAEKFLFGKKTKFDIPVRTNIFDLFGRNGVLAGMLKEAGGLLAGTFGGSFTKQVGNSLSGAVDVVGSVIDSVAVNTGGGSDADGGGDLQRRLANNEVVDLLRQQNATLVSIEATIQRCGCGTGQSFPEFPWGGQMPTPGGQSFPEFPWGGRMPTPGGQSYPQFPFDGKMPTPGGQELPPAFKDQFSGHAYENLLKFVDLAGTATMVASPWIGGAVGGKQGKIGGQVGGMVVGTAGQIVGGIFGGPAGAALGKMVGSLIGSVIGGLIGGAFEPSRIKVDKKEIRKFYKQADLGVPVPSRSETRYGWRDASKEYGEIEPALLALSLGYVDLDDKIEHVQGTMKRFGNNLQVGLQQMNATMGEAQEKVLELSEKMDFDLAKSLQNLEKFMEERPLSEYMEEVRENQTELIQVDDLLAGIIDLETEFSVLMDSSVLANRFISDAFSEAALAAGGAEEAVAKYAEQIRSGEMALEEAMHAFQQETGIVFHIKEVDLDEGEIRKQLEQAVKQIEIVDEELSNAITQAFDAGIGRADIGTSIQENFEQAVKGRLRTQVIETWYQENMGAVFEGIDWTQPIYEQADAWEAVKRRIQEVAPELYDMIAELGLLEDQELGVTVKLNNTGLTETLRDSLLEGIASGFSARELDRHISHTLNETIRGAMAETLVSDMIEELNPFKDIDFSLPPEELAAILEEAGQGLDGFGAKVRETLEAADLLPDPSEERIRSLTDTFRDVMRNGLEQGMTGAEIEGIFMEKVYAMQLDELLNKKMQEHDVMGRIERGDTTGIGQDVVQAMTLETGDTTALQTRLHEMLAELGLTDWLKVPPENIDEIIAQMKEKLTELDIDWKTDDITEFYTKLRESMAELDIDWKTDDIMAIAEKLQQMIATMDIDWKTDDITEFYTKLRESMAELDIDWKTDDIMAIAEKLQQMIATMDIDWKTDDITEFYTKLRESMAELDIDWKTDDIMAIAEKLQQMIATMDIDWKTDDITEFYTKLRESMAELDIDWKTDDIMAIAEKLQQMIATMDIDWKTEDATVIIAQFQELIAELSQQPVAQSTRSSGSFFTDFTGEITESEEYQSLIEQRRLNSLTSSFRDAVRTGVEQGMSGAQVEKIFMQKVHDIAFNQLLGQMMDEWDVMGHIQRGEDFDWKGFMRALREASQGLDGFSGEAERAAAFLGQAFGKLTDTVSRYTQNMVAIGAMTETEAAEINLDAITQRSMFHIGELQKQIDEYGIGAELTQIIGPGFLRPVDDGLRSALETAMGQLDIDWQRAGGDVDWTVLRDKLNEMMGQLDIDNIRDLDLTEFRNALEEALGAQRLDNIRDLDLTEFRNALEEALGAQRLDNIRDLDLTEFRNALEEALGAQRLDNIRDLDLTEFRNALEEALGAQRLDNIRDLDLTEFRNALEEALGDINFDDIRNLDLTEFRNALEDALQKTVPLNTGLTNTYQSDQPGHDISDLDRLPDQPDLMREVEKRRPIDVITGRRRTDKPEEVVDRHYYWRHRQQAENIYGTESQKFWMWHKAWLKQSHEEVGNENYERDKLWAEKEYARYAYGTDSHQFKKAVENWRDAPEKVIPPPPVDYEVPDNRIPDGTDTGDGADGGTDIQGARNVQLLKWQQAEHLQAIADAMVKVFQAKKSDLERQASEDIEAVNKELEDYLELKRIEREELQHLREVESERLQLMREQVREMQQLRNAFQSTNNSINDLIDRLIQEDPFQMFGERLGIVRREQSDIRRQIQEAEATGDLEKIPQLVDRLVELRGRELNIFKDTEDGLKTDAGQEFLKETMDELMALRKGNAGDFRRLIGDNEEQYFGLRKGIEEQIEIFDSGIADLESKIEASTAELERIDASLKQIAKDEKTQREQAEDQREAIRAQLETDIEKLRAETVAELEPIQDRIFELVGIQRDGTNFRLDAIHERLVELVEAAGREPDIENQPDPTTDTHQPDPTTVEIPNHPDAPENFDDKDRHYYWKRREDTLEKYGKDSAQFWMANWVWMRQHHQEVGMKNFERHELWAKLQIAKYSFGVDSPQYKKAMENWKNAPEKQAATGFTGLVSRPTKFTVAEAGPEFVSVIPKQQAMSSARKYEDMATDTPESGMGWQVHHMAMIRQQQRAFIGMTDRTPGYSEDSGNSGDMVQRSPYSRYGGLNFVGLGMHQQAQIAGRGGAIGQPISNINPVHSQTAPPPVLSPTIHVNMPSEPKNTSASPQNMPPLLIQQSGPKGMQARALFDQLEPLFLRWLETGRGRGAVRKASRPK